MKIFHYFFILNNEGIKIANRVKIGYFQQDLMILNEDKTKKYIISTDKEIDLRKNIFEIFHMSLHCLQL